MKAEEAISLIKSGKLPLQLYKDVATEEELRGSFAKLKAFADAIPEGDEAFYDSSIKWNEEKSENPLNDRVVWDTPYELLNVSIHPALITFRGRHVFLKTVGSDYKDWERIGDYWMDGVRLDCSFNGRQSPLAYYSSHAKEVVHQCLNEYKTITPHNLRETIYNMKACKECSSFKCYLMVAIGRLLGARRVLDFSSGWGDRMIGSIAAGFDYVGVDPNTKLVNRYQEAIKFLYDNAPANSIPSVDGKPRAARPTMICAPIETADLPKEKFDMCLTSPPYADLEIYSDEVTQSVHGKDGNKDWLHNFLIVAVDKVARHLKNGGYLVLVISQVRPGMYIEDMLKILDGYTFSDDQEYKLYYYGVISYGSKSPQPMWIWRKWIAAEVPRELYNPPAIYEKRSLDVLGAKINYRVLQDGYTVGGIKQRALSALWQKHPEKTTLVYGSPAEGAAQVAIAYTAKLLGKVGKLFVYKNRDLGYITKYASTISNGALDVEADPRYIIKVAEEMADKYAASDENVLRMTFGGGDAEYMAELEKSLRESMSELIKNIDKVNRIWITAGSATALNVLYRIFPNTKFVAVQVGKKVWPDQINDNTELIVSDESFVDIAEVQPPYDSVKTYDAKIWKYFAEQAQEGDVIYNVWRDTLAAELRGNEPDVSNSRIDNKLEAIEEKIKEYGSEMPMCYRTSEEILRMLSNTKPSREVVRDAASIPNSIVNKIKEVLSSGGVIDIIISISMDKHGANAKSDIANKIRESIGISNSFFIPRLFLHAFNLFCQDGKLYVSYSWFKKMPYKIYHVGNCADKWIDDLMNSANSFKKNPVDLFEMFVYPWRRDFTVKAIMRYAKTLQTLYYNVEMSYISG